MSFELAHHVPRIRAVELWMTGRREAPIAEPATCRSAKDRHLRSLAGLNISKRPARSSASEFDCTPGYVP